MPEPQIYKTVLCSVPWNLETSPLRTAPKNISRDPHKCLFTCQLTAALLGKENHREYDSVQQWECLQ